MPTSDFFTASIDLTKILELASKKHSGIAKSEKNQHTYASIKIFVNDTEDDYGQIGAILLNSRKGVVEDKVYIGNIRRPKSEPMSDNELTNASKTLQAVETIPAGTPTPQPSVNQTVQQPTTAIVDDLPF